MLYNEAGIFYNEPLNLLHELPYKIHAGCSMGDARLSGGSDNLRGRVEVCFDGVWGTVCSNSWSRADAAVVCRQLGFSSSGAIEHTNAAFGQGIGVILLDYVRCTGLEYRLYDCAKGSIGVTNCGHHQDAGVVCVSGISARTSCLLC